ncbi:hypothetical protein C2G38_2217887 [Gigaspora rosea]|uniref:Uncharacterized protein n=1 Tax=Gigaspora rosea TaxID=44941 RepID=A0A397UG61_9GLOM|nr:hypothetical protein C2G38_2217887 [Gigaspora rosea]
MPNINNDVIDLEFSNDNSTDMNIIPLFRYENNSLVDTNPFSTFSESNNNCSLSVISGNDASLNDDNSNSVDNDMSFSEYNSNENTGDLNASRYQYNLHVGACFDNWLSVDSFMHSYCLE